MEQELWRLKPIGSDEKKSGRRLFEILHLPVSGQTFKFFQTIDQTSICLIITPNSGKAW